MVHRTSVTLTNPEVGQDTSRTQQSMIGPWLWIKGRSPGREGCRNCHDVLGRLCCCIIIELIVEFGHQE